MVVEESIETHANGKINGALSADNPTPTSSPRAPESESLTLSGFYLTEAMMGELGLAEASPLARISGVKAAELRFVADRLLGSIKGNPQGLNSQDVLDQLVVLKEVIEDFEIILQPARSKTYQKN